MGIGKLKVKLVFLYDFLILLVVEGDLIFGNFKFQEIKKIARK
jgi:hypothetical protein